MYKVYRIVALATLFATVLPFIAGAQHIDTLYVSADCTTHLLFQTNINYIDIADTHVMGVRTGEQDKRVVALKAVSPFSKTTTVSVGESSGLFHTFVIRYSPTPDRMICDYRDFHTVAISDTQAENAGLGKKAVASGEVSEEFLQTVVSMPQEIFHICSKDGGIEVLCENIYAYNDVMYLSFSISNKSSVSYNAGPTAFSIESRKRVRRSLARNSSISPIISSGSMKVEPGEKTKFAFAFEKLTFSKDLVLRVYFTEEGGERNYDVTISCDDIVDAKQWKD